ncbi:MAG: hypothetical protein Fur0032_05350 [Terrimicrobiaceae bacterium]
MKTIPSREHPGFTLIELLVVIAIIAILAGLLFPAVTGALDSAKKSRAKSDVVQIAVAVKAYQSEYGRLPTDATADNDGGESSPAWFQGPETSSQYNKEIIQVLVGENYKGLNPRKIPFLETRPAKGTSGNYKDGMSPDFMLYDPWGTPYAIKLDISYNTEMEYYGLGSANNLRTTVFAVSFGKNKIQQDISKTVDKGQKVDDIVSFQ